ncbi:MAG: hypothetical protein JNL73_06880 [Anaerolineales bacterium]|nr:hypothetical protein [Anaerolineales bacterium]
MNDNLARRNSFGSWIAIGAGIGAALMAAGFGPAALAIGVGLGAALGALRSAR